MYQALYRKKRPNTFGTVIGQSPIVTTLCNQLRGGNISHAYLFCGTRGTGKTSTAKVFARAVNCLEAKETGEPCNNCEICQDILAERNLNVIEIDAASNNGVDNIRDLREEVRYPPTVGTYKVYIIDEAHMLTTAAFNALLKTLEEPPAHVIFVLATTDPQKIPATILSRCQRYDFKRIARADMVATLALYMEKENVETEADALEYIASVSDGAMRDALSILDQCLSLYADEVITLAKVQALLGAVDQSALFAYSDALVQNNSAAALAIIAETAKEGRDLSRFTADIITHFRNLLVAAQVTDHTDILDYAPETVERYRTQGKAIEPMTLISYIREFSELQNQMRYSAQERLALEVCTIKLCSQHSRPLSTISNSNPESDVAVSPTVNSVKDNATPTPIDENEVDAFKTGVASDIASSAAADTLAPLDVSTSDPTPVSVPSLGETPDDKLKVVVDNWSDFCAQLSGLLKSMLALCKVESGGEGLTIICRDKGSLQYMKDQQAQILEKITQYFQLAEEPFIVFIADEGYNDADTFKESISTQINMAVEFE